MPDRLYLDHAATTPVLPAARDAVVAGLAGWANPSSPHGAGRSARAALEEARGRVAAALGWQGEVLFTSGASEAIAIAIGRSERDALIVSTTEHDAVRRERVQAFALPVEASGMVARDALVGRLGALGAKRPMVAIQSVNNETGVIQPLDMLAEPVRAAGGLLFVDAAQGAGKLDLPDADVIAISGHKFGGPPGIGALLVRELGMLRPTGGQERGYRPGTENLPGALGMAAALEASRSWLDRAGRSARASRRRDRDGGRAGRGAIVTPNRDDRLLSHAGCRGACAVDPVRYRRDRGFCRKRLLLG